MVRAGTFPFTFPCTYPDAACRDMSRHYSPIAYCTRVQFGTVFCTRHLYLILMIKSPTPRCRPSNYVSFLFPQPHNPVTHHGQQATQTPPRSTLTLLLSTARGFQANSGVITPYRIWIRPPSQLPSPRVLGVALTFVALQPWDVCVTTAIWSVLVRYYKGGV